MICRGRLCLVLVAATSVMLVGASLYSRAFSGEITGFFRIGDVLPLSPYLNPAEVMIHENEIGYDGQFFLSLALDPFLTNSHTIESLDYPRYRIGRLLFPLLGYGGSLGNRAVVPYALVLINGLSILAMVLVLSELRHTKGFGEQSSLLLLCIPGIWIAFSFSTAEIVSSLLVIASYVTYRRDNANTSSILAGLACLAKEVTLIFWLASLITAFLEENRKRIVSLLLSIVPFVAFRVFLFIAFRTDLDSEFANFSWPLVGHMNRLQWWLAGDNLTKNEVAFYGVLLFAVVLLISKLPRTWKTDKILFLSSIGYLLIFIQSTTKILDYHVSYNRVLVMIYILVLLSSSGPRLSRVDKVFWTLSGLASLRFVYWYAR